MNFRIVSKSDVMSNLTNENLYLLRVAHRAVATNKESKYCSSKQVTSLTVREVMEAISDSNTAFIEIAEES